MKFVAPPELGVEPLNGVPRHRISERDAAEQYDAPEPRDMPKHGVRENGAGTGESADRGTRQRVCREVLERGPVTATQLAEVLGLTPAAVRRHLDLLLGEGLLGIWDAEESGRRGRGRPARRFVLTDAGHAAMATAYDDLAAAALDFLTEVGGPEAIRRFAARRAGQLTARYTAAVEAAGADSRDRAQALAGALTTDGYAATTRPLSGFGAAGNTSSNNAGNTAGVGNSGVGSSGVGSTAGNASTASIADRNGTAGSQLCQGHCPVQHVAARYPELCEAETEAFSTLLGVHVQRLATLAHGEHVCTTHVPKNTHVPRNTRDPKNARDPKSAVAPQGISVAELPKTQTNQHAGTPPHSVRSLDVQPFDAKEVSRERTSR